jgi:hypothetical protein
VPSNRPSPGKAPLGADLVIPALALGFAIYFFFSIADLVWEAKANGVKAICAPIRCGCRATRSESASPWLRLPWCSSRRCRGSG